jgi:ABC-2 type transport system permease protein/lipopolysaccharide transport system permease protein
MKQDKIVSHYTGPIPQGISYGMDQRSVVKAYQDIKEGWKRRALWGALGLQEIRQRYRRSRIGPFWLTISMGVMVVALGLLYGAILNQSIATYLPFLAAGFVIWGLISGMIMDGVRTFIDGEGLIKQLPAPISIHAYRACWINLIIFLHNIVIYFFVALWFGLAPNINILLVIPGVIIVLINGFWMTLLFGMLSARFRDIPQIITNIVQVMFFLTPILWNKDMLSNKIYIIEWNPFYYLVEIVRTPMMGFMPSWNIILGSLLITIIGSTVAFAFFCAFRWRIPYWV